jgi:hypothetical protein
VRCSIRVVGAGIREIVVPEDTFDASRRRLKVKVVRPAQSYMDADFDCPSQESEGLAYIVECPVSDGETTRLDVLAGFLSERTEEPAQVGDKA